MGTALITGVSGQDGSYLAELLVDKGYTVVGTTRNVDCTSKATAPDILNRIELAEWDMQDQQRIVELLNKFRPAEVYNFAAFSSGEGMFDEAERMGEVNGLAVTKILDAIREVNSRTRFCQASSSEMFGIPDESPQSECSRFFPRSPYGAAKLYAHNMIGIYRRVYGLFACSAILFNHESPRRGPRFVTGKVCRAAARISTGRETGLTLGDLNARRDWGFAGDSVRAMWLMLQAPAGDDFVIATEKTHSVRDLCERAFRRVGLDYRHYVSRSADAAREPELVQLVGNAGKARRELSWEPKMSFDELIDMIVDAELQSVTNTT